jgi:transcriptional regulator with XRE-family HTH domain
VSKGDEAEADPFLRSVARALRAQRRAMRIDQRELAARAGVSKSTVARLERGEGGVALGTFRRVLTEAGLALVLAHDDGVPWREDEALRTDALGVVDRAGRRFPAHLPAAPTGTMQSWDWARDRRWPRGSRTPWRYDFWSDDFEALVQDATAGAAGAVEGGTSDADDTEDDRP